MSVEILRIGKIRGHVERNSLPWRRRSHSVFSYQDMYVHAHVRISLVSCTNLSAGVAIRAKGVLWSLWISTSRWYRCQGNVPFRLRLILVISSFFRLSAKCLTPLSQHFAKLRQYLKAISILTTILFHGGYIFLLNDLMYTKSSGLDLLSLQRGAKRFGKTILNDVEEAR